MSLFRSRACLAVAALLGGAAARAEKIDFNREILPILSDACFHCHGPDAGTRKAKLRLDQREGLFRTREDVTVVVPGKPETSELILRITSPHEDEVMPPPEANRKLKPAEVETLKRWIAGGAPWGTHWAFSPPVRAEVPYGGATFQSPDASAAGKPPLRNPIDAFVGAKLTEQKLTPSPEAPRETLLRRVTLDLTGVPPTPAEL